VRQVGHLQRLGVYIISGLHSSIYRFTVKKNRISNTVSNAE